MKVPNMSDMFSAGRDLSLSAGDTATGGNQSFGNIGGPRVGGRSSDWLLNSVEGSQMPIAFGVLALVVVGGVVYFARGRK